MNLKELATFHDRRPFHPFAIHLSDGRSLAVNHPEFLARSPDASILIYWHEVHRREEIAGGHVTSLEQMPAQTNGRRKRK